MTKEPTRKCSHRGHNGNNSKACKGCNSIKLFGVKINVSDENHSRNGSHDPIRRTKSMGSLQQALKSDHGGTGIGSSAVDSGYLSDGLSDSARVRKKGTLWTEDEHRSFLIGLEKLGKGDWRGISRTYVRSRTPTQVASHAQKYFIRMSCSDKRKRRTSVFDLALNEMNQQDARSQCIPSSSSDKTPGEISKQASASPAASKNDESKGKGIETNSERLPISPEGRPPISGKGTASGVPNATYDRPPISPVSPLVVPNFNRRPYMNHPTTRVMPTVSWTPYVVYSNQNYANYSGEVRGNYATCVQYLLPQPAGLPLDPPQPAPPTKKDSLDCSIGALSLR